MPTTCEVDAFYLGSVGPLTALYAGATLVWPCYECLPDLELLDPQYADAIMYVVDACNVLVGSLPPTLKEHFSETTLTTGDGYNGISDITLGLGDSTWTFTPPTEPQIGETVVEATLVPIDNIVGHATSGISFYLTLTSDIDVADEGFFIQVEYIEVYLVASVLGGTQVKALVRKPTILNPLATIEIQATTDLTLLEETQIIVDYRKDETNGDTLTIYYNGLIVGEVQE